jgi:hypothetical protein
VLTAAPRPPAGPLLRAWARTAAQAETARALALWTPPGRGGTAHWLARGAWALERIAAAARTPGPATVWLPDDFCFTAAAALQAADARLVYYPVDETGGPDWPRCRALAETTPVDVFVAVHTFGRAVDGRAARAFADGHGALLAEDAAHVLRPSDSVGRVGDAVFFSPHKWFAVPDGAVLWLRDGLAAAPPPGPRTPAARWSLKRLIQDLLPDALQPSPAAHAPQGFADDPPAPGAPPAPAPSRVGLRLLATVGEAALDTAAAARRANHAAWAESLSGVDGVGIQAADDAPYRCVVLADAPARAEALFDAARAAGVPVETWPDVPPPVAADPETHAAALSLRARRVLFPVHQNLRAPELLTAGRAVAAALAD